MAATSVNFMSIKLDDKRLVRDLNNLRFEDQFRAAAAALNKVRTGIRTDVKHPIIRIVPIRNTPVTKRAASRLILPVRGKATWQKPIAVGLQLYKYVPKVWTLAAPKRAKQQLGPGEFVQTLKNGYVGVFKRTGAASKDGKGKMKTVNIDVSDLSLREVQAAIQLSASTRWPKEFAAAAKVWIDRRGR